MYSAQDYNSWGKRHNQSQQYKTKHTHALR